MHILLMHVKRGTLFYYLYVYSRQFSQVILSPVPPDFHRTLFTQQYTNTKFLFFTTKTPNRKTTIGVIYYITMTHFLLTLANISL